VRRHRCDGGGRRLGALRRCAERDAGDPLRALERRLVEGLSVDVANLQLVLAQLADTPDDRLAAQFRCAVAIVLPDGREATVHGEMRGRIVREPRGTNGFGYDPIFVPDGGVRTSAELSNQEKDAISHRGNALRALVPSSGRCSPSPATSRRRRGRRSPGACRSIPG